MEDERFEWDVDKARDNIADHGVDFEYATLVFDDPGATDDPDHTMDYGEERFRAVGMVDGWLIAVFYTPRDDRIRIISARKATRKEQREYARRNPPR